MKSILHTAAATQATLMGAYVMIPGSLSAYNMGALGFDWALIDMEHSPLSAEQATGMVHAVAHSSGGRTLTFVRTPSSGVEYVKWALDSGASGVIVPMVQSRKEAEAIARFALYPAAGGQRSFGPFQAVYAGSPAAMIPQYYATAAEGATAIVLMIESAQGVANARDITSVPGVSGIFVGSVDLRLSMGLQGPFGQEAEFLDALSTIATTCAEFDCLAGIFVPDPSLIPRLQAMGYTFFLIGGDSMFMAQGAAASLARARGQATVPPSSPKI